MQIFYLVLSRDVRQIFRLAHQTPIFQIFKSRQTQNTKNRPKLTPKIGQN